MAQINVNTRTTIILCIATLIIATGVGIITASWITQPLLKLNQSAKKLAQGEWEQSVVIQRHDEIGELANSLAQMATQLQASFAELQALNTALVESESRLNQILEAIPVGILVHDISGQIIYTNQTSKQLLGIEILPEVKLEDISVMYQVYQAGSEELYPVEKLPLVRAFQGEKVKVDDIELRLPDRTIPLEVYGTPLRDDTGTIVAAIATFTDITERKEAEQIIADYNQTLETKVWERTVELNEAQRLAHLGNWSFNVNPNKISWSDEVFRIYGRDFSQSEPSYNEILQQIHPDDVALFKHQFETAITEGKSYEHELRIFRSDGSMRYICGKGEAVFNSSGQVIQLFGTVQDITERKFIEEQLRESEEKFRQLAENIQDVFFILSHTGEMLYINPVYEQIWQRTRQSLYDNPRSWLDSVFPKDYPSTVAALERQLQDATDFDQVYRITRPNGEIRWIRARYFPVPHHNTYRFVGIAEDITIPIIFISALKETFDKVKAFEIGAADYISKPIETQEVLARIEHQLKLLRLQRQLKQENARLTQEIQERQTIEVKLRKSEASLLQAQRIAQIGNWEFDVRTRKITWSMEIYRIFGLDANQSEITYEDVLQRIHPDDQSLFKDSVQDAIASGIPYDIEFRVIRPNGQIRYVESRGEAMTNPQKQVIQLLGISVDMTERKQRQEALRLIAEGTAASDRKFRRVRRKLHALNR